MVVEDEKIVAADIRQNLTMLGYMVPAVLASGEEAIKKAAEQCPDLVLMDIQLKGRIDGIEAAKIVQSRLNVPVVFITAFAATNVSGDAFATLDFEGEVLLDPTRTGVGVSKYAYIRQA